MGSGMRHLWTEVFANRAQCHGIYGKPDAQIQVQMKHEMEECKWKKADAGGGRCMKNLKLKSARAALDMSQQQLAESVGVSRQTINAIEKGDYNPTIKLCRAICKALGKTLDDLFWEDEEDEEIKK